MQDHAKEKGTVYFLVLFSICKSQQKNDFSPVRFCWFPVVSYHPILFRKILPAWKLSERPYGDMYEFPVDRFLKSVRSYLREVLIFPQC